jgi:hypothetical protein
MQRCVFSLHQRRGNGTESNLLMRSLREGALIRVRSNEALHDDRL